MFKFYMVVALTCTILHATAQNELPGLSVDSLGKGRTRISWANPYGEGLVQVSIQSSYDSLKEFRTFFSSPSPQLPQNGVVDGRPSNGKMYYRIFYAFTGGSYSFTKSKQAGGEPIVQTDEPDTNIISAMGTRRFDTPLSKYVMINPRGFAEIKLPDADGKKYKVVFYDDHNAQVFTVDKIKDPNLVLDKTNFMHAGYFFFELYDGETLVEKNKIYLSRDF